MAVVRGFHRPRVALGLGLVPFAGSYDPSIDTGEGYSVSPGDYGAFDQAKSSYQIAQLQAAGATNIQYNPYTRQYVDASKTPIGTQADNWTASDQTALDARISTVLNDPSSTTAAKTLVSMPGYGTPAFDAATNSGSNPAQAQTIATLLQQSAAQATPAAAPTGDLYLVGGQYFHTLADAQKAQQALTDAGVTLLSQIAGANGAAPAGAGLTPDSGITGDVFDAGGGLVAGGGGGGEGGGPSSFSSLPLPMLAAAGGLAFLVFFARPSHRRRGRR